MVRETKAVEKIPNPAGARFLASNNWLPKKRTDESAPLKKRGYIPTKIFFTEYFICTAIKVFLFTFFISKDTPIRRGVSIYNSFKA